MPVKGKKKAQARGSQGRRRPAQAPRPVVAPRKPPAWYRTGPGRAVLVIVVLAVIGGVVAAVAATRGDSGAGDQAEALDRYTGEVRGVLQALRPAASDMIGAPTTLAKAKVRKELGSRAASWTKSIVMAQKEMGGLPPPASLQTAHDLFGESAELYLAAARTYSLAADVDGDLSARVLARAAEQRDHGGRLWQSATTLLDEQRAESELGPSGLLPPSLPGAQPQQEPASDQGDESGASGDGGGGG